jgi:hypothetical protein
MYPPTHGRAFKLLIKREVYSLFVEFVENVLMGVNGMQN